MRTPPRPGLRESTTAAAPSEIALHISRRIGSAIMREARTCSMLIGLRYCAMGLLTACEWFFMVIHSKASAPTSSSSIISRTRIASTAENCMPMLPMTSVSAELANAASVRLVSLTNIFSAPTTSTVS